MYKSSKKLLILLVLVIMTFSCFSQASALVYSPKAIQSVNLWAAFSTGQTWIQINCPIPANTCGYITVSATDSAAIQKVIDNCNNTRFNIQWFTETGAKLNTKGSDTAFLVAPKPTDKSGVAIMSLQPNAYVFGANYDTETMDSIKEVSTKIIVNGTFVATPKFDQRGNLIK